MADSALLRSVGYSLKPDQVEKGQYVGTVHATCVVRGVEAEVAK